MLNIKNHEADELARRLATVTGESITAAVTNALRERLRRVIDLSMKIGAREGQVGIGELDLLLQRAGKGRHAAGLNFGDCCAYALSKVSGEPLLAKGNDFRRTDIQLATVPQSSTNQL